MKTDLDHLPAAKQRELERVVQILFEEFRDAKAIATSDSKKQARILKVILYGSYARGVAFRIDAILLIAETARSIFRAPLSPCSRDCLKSPRVGQRQTGSGRPRP